MAIQLSGSLAVTGSVQVSQGFTGSLFGTASQAKSVSGGFTKSFAIINNNGGIPSIDNNSYPAWVATYPVTASVLMGVRTSGTGATVSASKNGSPLVASPLSITTTNTYVSTSVLQNQYFNPGDVLQFGLIGTTGTVCDVTIQVSFNY